MTKNKEMEDGMERGRKKEGREMDGRDGIFE